MSLPSIPTNFANVRAVAQTYIEYPFIEMGDSATKVYHMICQQAQSSYSASQLDLDDTMSSATSAGVISLPFTADASAYFVGDFNHSPIDGGMVEFERVFANIPADRDNEFSGTQVFSYPGIAITDEDITGGSNRTISGISGYASQGISIITVGSTGTMAVGDLVYISATWTGTIGIAFNGLRSIISKSPTTITVPYMIPGTTFTGGTLTELVRQPRAVDSKVTGSVVDVSYYLPGVTAGISDALDVVIDDTFIVMNTATMQKSDILSIFTVPSASEYETKVTNDDFLIVSSEVSRWKGNIIKKENRKVRAL
jgi:hypothetical protein